MPRDECLRLEQAVASESDIDEQLRRHAAACPRCAMLIEISRLAAPVVVVEDDGVARSLAETAQAIACRRATRWQRRQRTAPLVIGAAGWLLGAILMACGLVSGGTGGLAASAGRALPSLPAPDAMMITTPPADLRMIVPLLMASAAWLAVLWLLRARDRLSEVGTKDA
jgi:hypothetical protein